MIKLRDYLDSRKLKVEQFNVSPDFNFGVFIRNPDNLKLIRINDLIPFMDADVEEVRDTLSFGDAEMVLTKLTIIVHPNNSSLAKLTCVINDVSKLKFELMTKNKFDQEQVVIQLNSVLKQLEQIAL